MMLHAVLSNLDFVATFTVKNLNGDFINWGWRGHCCMIVFFYKILSSLNNGFPKHSVLKIDNSPASDSDTGVS